MLLRVHCYAGQNAEQCPVRFQLDDRDYTGGKSSTSGTARTTVPESVLAQLRDN